MGTIPATWPRFVRASINQLFTTGLPGQTLFVSGEVPALSGDSYFELRIRGPKFTQFQLNAWYIDVTVMLAVVVKKTVSNLYLKEDLIGLASQLFNTFPVMTLDSAGDTPTQLTCMALQGDIEIIEWGDISIGKDPVMATASTIQATFHGDVINGN